jgi:hypothetical protein
MFVGKYNHHWIVFYDKFLYSNLTSKAVIFKCNSLTGCSNVLSPYKIMETKIDGSLGEQYLTNAILIDNVDEIAFLKKNCVEENLIKNNQKWSSFSYEKYTTNLKDNNYVYQATDTAWCKKGEELKCKMNQNFLKQIIK